MPDFVVKHVTHGGDLIAEHRPAQLRWKYQIGQYGAGQISYAVPESDPALEHNAFAPKRTDYELWMGGARLMAGFCWSANMRFADDHVNVSGHDWLEWLENGSLVFDYDTDIDDVISAHDPDELYVVFDAGTTVQDIVEAILAPLSEDAGEQVILSPSFLGTVASEELVGSLQRSVGRTALSLLQELAAMDTPYGFDFWCQDDKSLIIWGPRRTSPSSIMPIYEFTDETTIVDGDWTNNGPAATDVLFLDGMGNNKRFFRSVHQPSVDQFRRWTKEVTIRNSTGPQGFSVGTQTEAEFKAQGVAYRLKFPQQELRLTIKPDVDPLLFLNLSMQAVWVEYTKPGSRYRGVHDYFWITSQEFYQSEDGSGDWLCDLTLDPIYVPIS